MKKKIPLQVLEIIEPFVNKKGIIFETIEPNGCLLKFIDKDANSDFYFNVTEYKIEQGLQLLIEWKPANKLTTSNKKTWIKPEQLNGYFDNWIQLIEGYEKVKTVFDDPILEAYADEYFTEFEIVDEDAEVKPFSSKQVLMLDSHLDNIQKKIERFQTSENESEIQRIKQEVIELRNNLTKKSKKWVIKQLSVIWGRITKQGPKLMKEFLSETKKHIMKEGIKYVFEKGTELM